MKLIETIEELEGHYGAVSTPARNKVLPRITPLYRAYIEASPFCALASVGPEGLDCSPRGDDGPVVDIVSDTRLALPDRMGNNRIDTTGTTAPTPTSCCHQARSTRFAWMTATMPRTRCARV